MIINKINLKYIFILLNCILMIQKIQNLQYLQTWTAIDNRYYIVFSKGIMFLNNYSNNFDWKHEFVDDQIISNEEESEMIYLNKFIDNIERGILIVKDYIYDLSLRGDIFCTKKLTIING